MKPYEPYIATDNSGLYVFLGPEVFLPSEGVGHGRLVGRAGGRFVVYVKVYPGLLGEDHPLRGLRKSERALWGLALARPVIRRRSSLVFAVERPYEEPFRHICIPPLGSSRWWVYKTRYPLDFIIIELFLQKRVWVYGDHGTYILEEGFVREYSGKDDVVTTHWPMSYCKAVLGVRFGLVRREDVECCEDVPRLWPSPLGSPMSIPGSGSLVGAELPVVRRPRGYLKVGSWLAWHRVLGLLDDGRWVLLGDDGLYEAVFTPTVEEPLEVFGEVGYVSVLRPYEGDVEDVASPCGAPRLVACGEEGVGVGRAVLRYVRGRLEEIGVRPELFMREFKCEESFIFPELVEVGIPARVIHDWPLTDPCPHVLRAANCEPFGLFTSGTRVPSYDL